MAGYAGNPAAGGAINTTGATASFVDVVAGDCAVKPRGPTAAISIITRGRLNFMGCADPTVIPENYSTLHPLFFSLFHFEFPLTPRLKSSSNCAPAFAATPDAIQK
jgi:hypothetical protein